MSHRPSSTTGAPVSSCTAKVSLHLTVHNFTCRIGEDADLQIALYDGREQKFISENYLVNWGRQGFIKNVDQLDNLRVLFTVSKLSYAPAIACLTNVLLHDFANTILTHMTTNTTTQ